MHTASLRSRPTRAGFTLIELLTTIAIVAVLAALTFAATHAVREKGRALKCASDLRQIGAAAHLYMGENRGRLPSSSHLRAEDGSSLSWTHTLAPYLGVNFLGRCPSVPNHPAKITYGWNDLLTEADGAGIPFNTCRTPSFTLAAAELALEQSAEHFHFQGAARGRVTSAMFKSFVNVECHRTGANYLFVDGHVQRLSWPEVQGRLALANGTFLQP